MGFYIVFREDQQYKLSSICSGMGSMIVYSYFYTFRTFYWSPYVIKLIAKPICPNRPLRPILCK